MLIFNINKMTQSFITYRNKFIYSNKLQYLTDYGRVHDQLASNVKNPKMGKNSDKILIVI